MPSNDHEIEHPVTTSTTIDDIVNTIRSTVYGAGLKLQQLELSLPHRVCHPNGAHGHWRQIAKRKREAKEIAYLEAQAQLRKAWKVKAAIVETTFVLAVQRKRDPDNLIAWVKPVIDGIVAAGLLADDNALVWMPPRIEIEKSEFLKVMLWY